MSPIRCNMRRQGGNGFYQSSRRSARPRVPLGWTPYGSFHATHGYMLAAGLPLGDALGPQAALSPPIGRDLLPVMETEG